MTTPAQSVADATLPRPAPFTDRYVEAGGLRLHYLDYGTAGRTPMLCIHGGAAHAHWFDYVAGGFSANHHVLAIDQRGHGESPWVEEPRYTYADYAADIEKVVEALGLREFVLIGHSMGGMVSLYYAAHHPGRVKRLVVIDTSLHMSEERVASMHEIASRPAAAYASQEELLTRFRLRPGNTHAAPEVVRRMGRYGSRQQADGTWSLRFDRQVYGTRVRVNGIPFWSNVRVPALLVKGGLSRRITPEIYAKVKELCPQTELDEVAGADHHVTLDNPAGFVSVVRAFLARHP